MAAYFMDWGKEWHVGEPIPDRVLSQRVVTIQADGDELDLILRAMAPDQIGVPRHGHNHT